MGSVLHTLLIDGMKNSVQKSLREEELILGPILKAQSHVVRITQKPKLKTLACQMLPTVGKQ